MKIHLTLFLGFAAMILPGYTKAQTIHTVAGTGTIAFRGDGGPAIAAELYGPREIVADRTGNLYVSDQNNNVIRKISTTGIITTYAGTTVPGYNGDGGQAALAELSFPGGLAIDSTGNLYIADTRNNRIRMVTPTGIIMTVAGNGNQAYSGDGGAAILAELSFPVAVALDRSGNLYISDAGNYRLRRVDASGIITTYAGTGVQGYNGDGGPATIADVYGPNGVVADGAGNVYFVDDHERVRMVDPSGIITTIAGNGTQGYTGDGGAATLAQLHHASGISIDNAGNLYIAEIENNCIRKISTGGMISTVAGNGSRGYSGDGGAATSALLSGSSGIFVDAAGTMYIADCNNNRIRKVDPSGTITTIAGNGIVGYSGEGGPAISAEISYAREIALDKAGNLFISDGYVNRVLKMNRSGIITTIAGNGTWGYSGDSGPATAAQLKYPGGITVDTAGNIYFTESNNRIVRKVDPAGIISTFAGNGTIGYSGDGGPATSAQLTLPAALTTDRYGNVYITDFNTIRKVNTSGIISTIAGTGVTGFSGDGGPATAAQISFPGGIATDTAGNIYIADSDNHRVRKIDASGIITTIATCSANGIALDKKGNIYAGISGAHCIAKIDTLNTFTVIAGIQGSEGFSGDGGKATDAKLRYPVGVAVDDAGNIFIADGNNQRIRVVSGPSAAGDSICRGSSILLSASGVGTLGWYDAPVGGTYLGGGDSYLTPLLSVSTTYYVQDSGTTGSSLRTAVYVKVDSLPHVTTSISGATITASETNVSYQWLNCNNNFPLPAETNQLFTATSNGSYAVAVSFAGCRDTSACVELISVGVDKPASKGYLSAFPNPSGGQLTITFTAGSDLPGKEGELTLYNHLGEAVLSERITSGKQLDLYSLPGGIYMIEVRTEKAILRRKQVLN
jgi:sugar lactone lactonase YvrE